MSRTVTLREVALIDRQGIAADRIISGTLFVGLENIASSGDFVNVGTVDAGELASTKFRFCSDHVLYGKLRPYLSKIALPNFSGVCSTDILPIRPGPEIDRSYLFHFLRQPRMVRLAANRCSGANLPRLSPREIEEFEIPLPPLEEQKRIAVILDKADILRRKRQHTIEMTDQFLRSVFFDMFEKHASDDDLYLSVNDLASKQKGAIRTGPFGSQLLHSEFVNEGIAVLGIDNAVSNKFRWGQRRFITLAKYKELARYTVRPGDVLITIMGTCGRCAVAPADIPVAINTKHLCCITLDQARCLPEYLRAYFLFHRVARAYLERSTKGAIMDGLNMAIIKDLPVLVPPIEKQRKFLELSNCIDKRTSLLESSKDLVHELTLALQQRAFR